MFEKKALVRQKISMSSGTRGGSETSANAVAHENIRVYYVYDGVCKNFLEISVNFFKNYPQLIFL